LIKTIGIICPECGRKNAYNSDKNSPKEVTVSWLKCVFCKRKSNTEEWK